MHWLVGLLALAAIAMAVWQLEQAAQGLDIRTQRIGTTPVTVFRPAVTATSAAAAATAPAAPPPVVLIAHGFAGSQQLMQPFALTLARNGWIAITFDFPGHGRNTAPMRGGLADAAASQRVLLASMVEMGGLARQLSLQAGGDGRYAVVGHSMASDIIVRHAQAQPGVQASVGVSLFAPSITAATAPDSPRNLLVIAGAWEPGVMATEALRVVAKVAGPGAALDTAYGRFDDGTARRATLSPGVEHIGVLYSAHTLAQTLAWLNTAFGRGQEAAGAATAATAATATAATAETTAGAPGTVSTASPFIDARGPWLGLLLAGVLALAWPLSRLLPSGLSRLVPDQVTGRMTSLVPDRVPDFQTPAGASPDAAPRERLRWWRWRGQTLPTLLPAVLTPLLLWPLPGDFLPVLLGDYLLLHFALYGVLTALLLWWAGRPLPRIAPGRGLAFVAAVCLTTAFALLAVGAVVDRYIFNVVPEAVRLPLIAALFAGTLPWFLADEWLTRGAAVAPGGHPSAPQRGAHLLAPPRGAYFVSKLCFLLSLVIAIALNPGRLFFLAIIVPAILLLFVMYGLFSRWVHQRTGHPAVAAVANALAFACFIAVSFPLVA